MGDKPKLVTSKDVSLKPKPKRVESLANYEPLDEELDIREQELELEEQELRYRSKVRAGLTGGQIVLLIVVVLIVVAAVAVIIYLVSQQSNFNPGPSNFGNVGESCVSKPCASPLVCEGSICRGVLGSPCLGSNCSTGYVCFNNQCFVGQFGRCQSATDCQPGLTCSQATCITAP